MKISVKIAKSTLHIQHSIISFPHTYLFIYFFGDTVSTQGLEFARQVFDYLLQSLALYWLVIF
jgi:hypothetical protein